MDKWRHRVHLRTLRFGDQNHDVEILVNILVRHGFLGRLVRGDKYGKVLAAGVIRFKNTVPSLANQPAGWKGTTFGGPAADALVALG